MVSLCYLVVRTPVKARYAKIVRLIGKPSALPYLNGMASWRFADPAVLLQVSSMLSRAFKCRADYHKDKAGIVTMDLSIL